MRLCGVRYFRTILERGRKKGWKRENGLPWKKTHFPLRISRSRAHPFPSSKSEKNQREFVHRNAKEGAESEGVTKGMWRIREERKRLTGSTFIQAISSRAGRTRRNIDSHVGGIDYDPPYPPTPRSIARLWINGWDDRFILIRINANLSRNACMYACITTDNNTTQGGTRISVPFHFAITLEPLKLSSSKGCMMVIRHSRERGLKIGTWICVRVMYERIQLHTMLVK